MNKRLYKTSEGAMIAGVCAGIAEYFNVDVTLIRLGFVLLTMMGGAGLPVYVIAAIVMPSKWQVMGTQAYGPRPSAASAGEQTRPEEEEPIIEGHYTTEDGSRPPSSRNGQVLLAYVFIFIGGYILLDRYVNVRYFVRRWWPAVFVIIGVVILLNNVSNSQTKS